MQNNNIIQLYQPINRNQKRMPVNSDEISMQSKSLKISEIRLLSINRASRLLGIRYESVQKLVKTGKIKTVIINNKHKIPYLNLIEFANNGSNAADVAKPVIPIEETQNRIDNLLKEYAG